MLSTFWQQTFGELGNCHRVLDIASGRGALLDHLDASGVQAEQVIATDYSVAGLHSLKQSRRHVLVVGSDAAAMPFAEGSVDLVTSQFGVEYAGPGAVLDAGKYVAPSGRIVLMLHCRKSVIYSECQANLLALKELKDSQFLPLAEDMFQSGYLVIRGQIGRKEAGAMARRVIEPFNGLRQILDRYGEEVAGGTIKTLYEETARIQQRFQYHLEDEVMGWVRSMQVEVDSYIGRMESMLNAALDETEIDKIIQGWQQQGLHVVNRALINDEQQRALAWVIQATKS